MLHVMMLCTASASNLYLLPVCGAANFDFYRTLIDPCGLVWSYYEPHMTVQCHWIQQIFPNGQGAKFSHLSHGISDYNLT